MGKHLFDYIVCGLALLTGWRLGRPEANFTWKASLLVDNQEGNIWPTGCRFLTCYVIQHCFPWPPRRDVNFSSGKVHALVRDRHRSRQFIEFLRLLVPPIRQHRD